MDQQQAAEQAGGRTMIVCEPNIDISDAEKLLEDLRATLDSASQVEIDASKVERIDTAALQLFLAFILASQQQGLEVVWSGVSEPMLAAANILGIAEAMGLIVHSN